ncbi:peptidase domain-containing ABC transporter [Dendronalium sp. ChiSLP03b]|uniref:peptidase domain-containing ABC transporter n=1 Tax=Dendronalium sp. ChiSLP03b TaxID=3075381 RepID=UPI002AD51AFA|nr:peptidase domain-containing ABC transporter [Dendronalium sp. ChiSLP03b]MDZ8207497.1 peptidase domain-containing ABC transporter [Dendronalium sp. ChiSLP03b]
MNVLKKVQQMYLPLEAIGWRLKYLISPVRWRFLQHYQRRVPIRLQLNAVECGAACLAMILSYYGRQTQVAECREFMGISRDGVTAQTIARTARAYGLRVKAYSLEELADFKYVHLPAIVYWNFEHFIVVERWSSKSVEIVDPSCGRRKLTVDRFHEGFTGVVLTFEPGVQFQYRRTKAQLSWWDYLLEYILHTPGLLLQILSTSLLLQILGLALPILTKVVVDRILPLHITDVMPILGLGMMILVLAQMVTSYLRAALLIYLQARIDTRLMLGFFEHLLTLPFRFFEQRTVGDLLMRLGSNAMIRETLTSQTLSIILDGTFVLGYLILLFVQEPAFGVVVSIVGLLQVMLLFGTTNRVHDLMQRDLLAQAESQSYLVEALTGILTLKACGSEDRAFEYWSNLFFKQLNVSLQRNHLGALVDTAMLSLRSFSPLVLLWVGALYVLDGSMSLGTMLALNAIAASFLMPLSSLVSNGQRLQLVDAHLERLTDVLTAESEQKLQKVQTAPRLTGRIELDRVSFRYDRNAPSVLHNISLSIEPGQKIALVGRSGSGKSTLAKLLLGLYLPTEGEILYDGMPLQALNWRTLRSQFGVVLQEPFLFSGSIRQNISINDPSLSLEQIVAAAELAAIHDDIMQMPMGYETRVAEGGSGLSGGQRQRLSLARAFAHQPAILLLDEATSHLDVVTESSIEQNLHHISCTRIAIAHRLSTIRNADTILVLDRGRIVEQGSHEELLHLDGHYASLIRSLDFGEVKV